MAYGRRALSGIYPLLVFFCCVGACHKASIPGLDELVVGIENEPLQLDPRFAQDGNSQGIDLLVFNGLMKENDRLEMVPDLAAAVRQTGPSAYVFTLRQGVRFQDGSLLRP